jgi:hypothetical protein
MGGCGLDSLAQDRDHWWANELLGSIKGREFLDHLSKYYYIKKDSVSWS